MEQAGFFHYLRAKWRVAAALALFTAIFAGVFFLYGLDEEPVLYAAGLCALAGAGLIGAGYWRYRREHMLRRAALASLPERAEPLPEAAAPGEEDFRAMAEKMSGAYRAAVSGSARERAENLDWFTAWVHQIKTPIAVMHMTLQGEDTPEHRALEGELFRVRQYADMALNYLRLGEGSGDLLIRMYPLDDIIRQAVRKYAPQFVMKRLTLRYDGTGERALTDEKWLGFILEQLLDNAVKYTAAGSVTVAVSPGPVVRITDTGIGVAADDLPRIFEKGFTGYNGRTDRSATGLGLYLCRRAAEKLHHRLWAESAPGEGSTFYLDLHSDPLEVE